MSAILLVLGVWIVFGSVFGDTSHLTGSQVARRCALGALLVLAGLGVVAFQVWALLY